MFIIQSQDDLLNFIRSNLSGDRNLSIRGVARLCGVEHTSIVRDGAFNSEKLGQTLTAQGFQAGALVENGFNAKATWLVIEYFAYESKAKALIAKQIARTFGQLGIELTFSKLVEEQPKVIELPRQQPPVRDTIEYIQAARDLETLPCPILRSYLSQSLMEEVSKNLKLPVTKDNDGDDLVLCAVLARDLGYTLAPGQDAVLGKFVKRHHEPRGQTQHGRYNVNVYS